MSWCNLQTNKRALTELTATTRQTFNAGSSWNNLNIATHHDFTPWKAHPAQCSMGSCQLVKIVMLLCMTWKTDDMSMSQCLKFIMFQYVSNVYHVPIVLEEAHSVQKPPPCVFPSRATSHKRNEGHPHSEVFTVWDVDDIWNKDRYVFCNQKLVLAYVRSVSIGWSSPQQIETAGNFFPTMHPDNAMNSH